MDVHYVIRYTDCPAMLVETAFIDNVDDNALLVEREDDFARAIALDIPDYVKAYASWILLLRKNKFTPAL